MLCNGGQGKEIKMSEKGDTFIFGVNYVTVSTYSQVEIV